MGYVLDPSTEAEMLGYNPYTGQALQYTEKEFQQTIPSSALLAAPSVYGPYYANGNGNGQVSIPGGYNVPSQYPKTIQEGEVLAAGIGPGMAIPAVLAFLAKYFPSIARLVGGAGGVATAVTGGAAAVGLGAAAYNLLGFGQQGMIPGTGIPLVGPFAPEPPANMIAKEWSTGTARFYMLIDGSIVTRRKNGVWKRWRPARHIVVSRNPRMGTLVKAHKRTSRLMKHFTVRIARRMKK